MMATLMDRLKIIALEEVCLIPDVIDRDLPSIGQPTGELVRKRPASG